MLAFDADDVHLLGGETDDPLRKMPPELDGAVLENVRSSEELSE
jgi:hypothetical protein